MHKEKHFKVVFQLAKHPPLQLDLTETDRSAANTLSETWRGCIDPSLGQRRMRLLKQRGRGLFPLCSQGLTSDWLGSQLDETFKTKTDWTSESLIQISKAKMVQLSLSHKSNIWLHIFARVELGGSREMSYHIIFPEWDRIDIFRSNKETFLNTWCFKIE